MGVSRDIVACALSSLSALREVAVTVVLFIRCCFRFVVSLRTSLRAFCLQGYSLSALRDGCVAFFHL